MDYFAGLDISMDETHVCVLDVRLIGPQLVTPYSKSKSHRAEGAPDHSASESVEIAICARG
jgi:hypothetical protein